SFAEWLDFAEKIDVSAARSIILEKLRTTAVEDPETLLRMARVAFRQGDTRLALALAHRASDQARDDASIKSAIIEIAYYHSEFAKHGLDLNDLAFPDSAFELACKHILENPRRMDADEHVIVLSNSSLGGGGAERQIAMTLSALSKLESANFSLHLVC